MDSFTDFASFHVRRALHRGQIALLCCTVLVNYTVPLVALGTLSTSDNAPTAVHLLFLTLFANSGLRHQFLAPASGTINLPLFNRAKLENVFPNLIFFSGAAFGLAGGRAGDSPKSSDHPGLVTVCCLDAAWDGSECG